MTSLQRPEVPVGTWKHSSLLWSSQNAMRDTPWFAMTMNIAHGKTFFLGFWLAGIHAKHSGQILLEFVCLWVLSSPSCNLNSDSVTEHRCWTFTEIGISEEKGNCMRKLNKGEDKSKETRLPTLFADLPEKALCPIRCFHSVDLVFIFTQLDSTSVSQKKAVLTKLACWSIKRRDK